MKTIHSSVFNGLLCTFLLSLFLFSCSDDKYAEFQNQKLNVPLIPEDFETIDDGKKSSGYFVYPSFGQKLDREFAFVLKANRNSTTPRYAILLYQDGHYAWNDYWGNEGLTGMHYIHYGEHDHSKFKLGRAQAHIWHLNNNRWEHKTGIFIHLRHHWSDPVPSGNQITSLCGWRTLSSGLDCHSGMDIGHSRGGAVVENNPVHAVAGGKVVESDPGNASSVTIQHAGGRYFTRYRHLNSIDVGRNVNVRKGQQIGTLGKKGTRVPHLHFEYFFGVNPATFINDEDNHYSCALANFCYMNTNIARVDNDNDVDESLDWFCASVNYLDRDCD